MKTMTYPNEQTRQQLLKIIELCAEQQLDADYVAYLLAAGRLASTETADAVFQHRLPALLTEVEAPNAAAFASLTAEHQELIWQRVQRLELAQLPEAAFVSFFHFALDTTQQGTVFSHQLPANRTITELALGLCSVGEGHAVLNLRAGSGEVLSFLPAETRYCGIEPRSYLRALATLRLKMTHRNANAVQASLETAAANWPRHFNGIISLGLETNDRAEATTQLVQQVLHLMSPTGKAVLAINSWEFLCASEHMGLRRQLVETGVLTTVIELSGKYWPEDSFGGQAVLLLLDQARPHAGKIRFCKAEDEWLSTDANGRIDSLQAQQRILAALNDPQAPDAAFTVAAHQLAAADYLLLPHLYSPVTDPTAVVERPLGELVRVVRRRAVAPGSKPQFVLGLRQLQQASANGSVEEQMLAKSARPTETYSQLALDSDALVVSLAGPSLCAAVISKDLGRYDGFWVQQSLLVLLETADQFFNEYLATELNSDFVQAQVARLRESKGTTIRLRQADLMRVNVRIPGLPVQYARLKAAEAARKSAEVALEAKRQAAKAEVFAQLGTLKHALSRPLAGLNGAVGTLTHFLERQAASGQPVSLASPVREGFVVSAADTLAAMRDQLTYIGELLSRSEAELVPEDYPKTDIDFGAYLGRLVTRVQRTNPGFKLTLRNQLGAATKPVFVNANEHLLDMLFNHILDNAKRHGFADMTDPRNEVRIVAELINKKDSVIAKNSKKKKLRPGFRDQISRPLPQDFAVVTIENNGRPLPENFGVGKLTRKHVKAGDTGNTGIGGYEVHQILAFFDSNLALTSIPDDEWPVSYGFRLGIVDKTGEVSDEEWENSISQIMLDENLSGIKKILS